MLATSEPKTITSLWGKENLQVKYLDIGQGAPILYLHGWGQNQRAFFPLIESLSNSYRHIILDFPGFGQSTQPSETWGVSEYADFVHGFIQHLGLSSCAIVGHSFGGRVGLRLACQHPECASGLFLIASAGLRGRAPFLRRMRISAIRSLARIAQRCLPLIGEKIKQALYSRIASRDYQQAGSMRAIFVKVVTDDLRDILPQIHCPVSFLYGANDTEAPPEMGKEMHALLPNSTYLELPGFDHYSILTRGRHQVGHQLNNFLQTNNLLPKIERETNE
jgi:pimeloyl-ACP methyl ester carboxylesterase